jgi:hypothetical protein
MHPNPQGPNVLANEALGAILLRGLGFLVPDWRPVTINLKTLRFFPELVMASAEGNTFPACGIHFGSEYVGAPHSGVFDLMPESYRHKVKNADQFAAISIFDLWANHHDERQCVYRREKVGEPYEAIFIDNGHLFGGPAWSEETDRAERSFLLDVERPSLRDPKIERWFGSFEGRIPQMLQDAVDKVPRDWYQGDIASLYGRLIKRLRGLRTMVDQATSHRFRDRLCRNAAMAAEM